MDFILNGLPVAVEVEPGTSLLEVLREDFGLRSMKDGCAPEGSCGACTVLVDGRPVVSCAREAERVAGREVVTLEGLPPGARSAWADAFVATGASQCGFCSPGIVMKAEGLLAREASPSRDEIARALAGNLCRCTGYVKIVDAIEDVAAVRAGKPGRAVDRGSGAVGARADRIGAREMALGEQPFVADMLVPGMLHGALRFSDHPRAIVRRIDVPRAQAAPGVTAVVTGPTCPATGSSASSATTGRSSSPRASRRATSGTCWRRSPRARGAGAGGGRPGRGRVRGPGADRGPVRRPGARRPGDPRQREPAGDIDRSPGRCIDSPGRLRPCRPGALHDQRGGARLPGARGLPRGARSGTRRARAPALLAGPGRLGGPAPGRVAPGPGRGVGPGHPGGDGRRVRRQGGPVRPGPGRAPRPRHRPARPAGLSRRESASPPPEAPRDHARLRGRLRCRGTPAGRARPDRRRHRRLRQRRGEGPRAGGGARLRRLPGPQRGRGGAHRLHQQPAGRRIPRLRRPPGDVRDGRLPATDSRSESASTAGRSAGGTSSGPATGSGAGSSSDRASAWRRHCWPCGTPTAERGWSGSPAARRTSGSATG